MKKKSRFLIGFLYLVLSGVFSYAQQKPQISALFTSGYPLQKIKVLEARPLGKTIFRGFDFAVPYRFGLNFEKKYNDRVSLGYDLSYLLMRQVIKDSDHRVVVRNYYHYSALTPYLKAKCYHQFSASIGVDVAYLFSFSSIDRKLMANPKPVAPYLPKKLISAFVCKVHYQPVNRIEVQLGYNYSFTNFSELSPFGPRPTALFYNNYYQFGLKYSLVGYPSNRLNKEI